MKRIIYNIIFTFFAFAAAGQTIINTASVGGSPCDSITFDSAGVIVTHYMCDTIPLADDRDTLYYKDTLGNWLQLVNGDSIFLLENQDASEHLDTLYYHDSLGVWQELTNGDSLFFAQNNTVESDSSCYVIATYQNIRNRRNAGTLTPNCTYCANNTGQAGATLICVRADGPGLLGSIGSYYNGTNTTGYPCEYNIDLNDLLYLRDRNNNQFHGNNTITNAWTRGIIDDPQIRDCYFENANRVYLTPNTTGVVLTDCRFISNVYVDLRNATGNWYKVEVRDGSYVNLNNASSFDFDDVHFLTSSYLLANNTTALIRLQEVTFMSNGYLRVINPATLRMRYSTIAGGRITLINNTNLSFADYLNLNSYGQLYISGTGTYDWRYCNVSNQGYFRSTGSNGGTMIMRGLKSSRGYHYNLNANPLVYDETAQSYAYIYSNATSERRYRNVVDRGYFYTNQNANTVYFVDNNIDSYGIFYFRLLTGSGRIYYNKLSSYSYQRILNGGVNTRWYRNTTLSQAYLLANNMNFTVQNCYVFGRITQNLSNITYTNKGRDYFNNNY